jgi:DNA-directed RNA polymerase subunit M/transcription elongation factor TFIIS
MTLTVKHPIREPQLCPECGFLLHFKADAAGRLVAYCEGCEIEIPIVPAPEAGSASQQERTKKKALSRAQRLARSDGQWCHVAEATKFALN